jgi:hypothetical protein
MLRDIKQILLTGLKMDLTKIKEHLPIYAEGMGGLEGASDVHIGNVDHLEGSEYIKITKHSAPDGQHHWFPVSWVRAVDERALYLNITVDKALAQLINEQPADA